MFSVISDLINRDGGFKNKRLLSDRALYPAARAIYVEGVETFNFENMRICNFDYGLYAYESSAFVIRNLYPFGIGTDGIRIDKPNPRNSTDHRIYDTQSAGGRYGFNFTNTAAVMMVGCRPQVSGVANLFLNNSSRFNINGGFCDSAVAHSSGGTDGMRIVSSSHININNVIFYSNGAGGFHIRLVAAGDVAPNARCEQIDILGCDFSQASGQDVTAISLSNPVGSAAFYRYISIIGNDFGSVGTAAQGLNNVSHDLQVHGNRGNTAALNKVQTITATSGTAEINAWTEIVRCTATLTGTLELTLTGRDNYLGKTVHVYRTGGGASNILVKSCNGSSTVGTLESAGSWGEFYVNAPNVNPTSATYIQAGP